MKAGMLVKVGNGVGRVVEINGDVVSVEFSVTVGAERYEHPIETYNISDLQPVIDPFEGEYVYVAGKRVVAPGRAG